MTEIRGLLVDIAGREIYPACIHFSNGSITQIERVAEAPQQYIMPGFTDAHVHIESSLLAPSEFARMAVIHGTIATISDPHEIANVLGVPGVEWMIDNGNKVPFYFHFGAPSCVPATAFETAGATVSVEETDALMARPDIVYLSEMMNFPGVIYNDPEVLAKIACAHKHGKTVDGHAPGLRGENLHKYVSAGIHTDHECYTLEEAEEKIALGMKVLIREGSAARNFDTLIPLMQQHADMLMFCSDDKHPDSLLLGHINQLAARAVALGYDVFDVLQVACLNPHKHYGMRQGLLRAGDPADFIVVNNLTEFIVQETWIQGACVARKGVTHIPSVEVHAVNKFKAGLPAVEDLKYLPANPEPVMVCLDGQLITLREEVAFENLSAAHDCLKLVVLNRYAPAKPAVCYIKGFGLKQGAIAGSVAHDSHNILAVGVTDEDILKAIQKVIEAEGGLAAVSPQSELLLPLPVAGLMSNADAWEVSRAYTALDTFSKDVLGSNLRAPFMSLSFMALLVIPHLKLSDLGLFNGDTFSFVRKV